MEQAEVGGGVGKHYYAERYSSWSSASQAQPRLDRGEWSGIGVDRRKKGTQTEAVAAAQQSVMQHAARHQRQQKQKERCSLKV